MFTPAQHKYNWDILSQLKKVIPFWQINNQRETEKIINLIHFYINKIEKCKIKHPIIFLAEESPYKFLSIFFASVITNSCLFLLNPNWQEREYQGILKIVKPDLYFGVNNHFFLQSISNKSKKKENHLEKKRFSGIMIPTGGTSGKIKFAIHTWQTLTNSAQGFIKYFQQEKINSYCCLPLYHVSGLMQIIRSLISQGQLIIYPYSQLKKNITNLSIYPHYFISLVPTQLKFILDNNPQWLTNFQTVLVGGASTNYYLKKLARKYQIHLALTYGMTETASGVSILKYQDFLNNNDSNGKILSHVEITIHKSLVDTDKYLQNQGIIKIKSSSLFKGYYPDYLVNDNFITDDIGYFDEENNLYILGRNSQKIISGGENIFPEEVVNAIWLTGLVKDVCILGKKDDYWGEIVMAFYVPINEQISEQEIKDQLQNKIVNYKIPKIWHQLNDIPRNQQGKIDYQFLSRF